MSKLPDTNKKVIFEEDIAIAIRKCLEDGYDPIIISPIDFKYYKTGSEYFELLKSIIDQEDSLSYDPDWSWFDFLNHLIDEGIIYIVILENEIEIREITYYSEYAEDALDNLVLGVLELCKFINYNKNKISSDNSKSVPKLSIPGFN